MKSKETKAIYKDLNTKKELKALKKNKNKFFNGENSYYEKLEKIKKKK